MKPLQNQSVWLNNLPFLMLPPLFWAGNFVVGKVVSDEVPPFTLAFGRWVLAFIVLLPFALPHIRRDWRLYGQNLPRIAATAVVGVMAFNTLIYKGLHDTTTTNALLLNSCIPVLIILFGRLFYGQKLKASCSRCRSDTCIRHFLSLRKRLLKTQNCRIQESDLR